MQDFKLFFALIMNRPYVKTPCCVSISLVYHAIHTPRCTVERFLILVNQVTTRKEREGRKKVIFKMCAAMLGIACAIFSCCCPEIFVSLQCDA